MDFPSIKGSVNVRGLSKEDIVIDKGDHVKIITGVSSIIMSYNIREMNIIFYDGDCGLCNRFVKFVLRFEKSSLFYFSPLSSELAKSELHEQSLDNIVPL